MHCATCGKENAPDSRFCGSCGVRLVATSRPRIAPTARILDIAPAAPVASAAAAAAAVSAATAAPAAEISEPVLSAPSSSYIPLPQRSAALPRRRAPIVVIVLLDLGLAIAGSAMLAKGLAKPTLEAIPASVPAPPTVHLDAAETSGASGSDHEPQQPATPNVEAKPVPPLRQRATRASVPPSTPRQPRLAAPPIGPAPDTTNSPRETVNGSPLVPSKHGATGSEPVAQRQDAKNPPRTGRRQDTSSPPAGQRDPLQSLASEIELAAERTRAEFDACAAGAGGTTVIHGAITIAFRVVSDGRISNVAAVENTTGSVELAACLVAKIAHWSFASRPTSPASFTRTFNYR